MNDTAHPKRALNVLLVEDNPADAQLVRLALTTNWDTAVAITESVRLADAISVLDAGAFDIVLLDLGLPDSRGLPTFSVLHARFRRVPVVVLSALADEATMLDAVRLGAQDYLIKGHFDAALLARVMRHAMERNQLLEQLESSLGYVRKLLQSTEGPAPGVESAATFAMCTGCKKLRAGSGRWETVEEFLAPRAQVQLTHETCPDCVSELEKET